MWRSLQTFSMLLVSFTARLPASHRRPWWFWKWRGVLAPINSNVGSFTLLGATGRSEGAALVGAVGRRDEAQSVSTRVLSQVFITETFTGTLTQRPRKKETPDLVSKCKKHLRIWKNIKSFHVLYNIITKKHNIYTFDEKDCFNFWGEKRKTSAVPHEHEILLIPVCVSVSPTFDCFLIDVCC